VSDPGVNPLEYESAEVGRIPISRLAVTVFWLGWLQIFPFQMIFIDRGLQQNSALFMGFFPPFLLCALSLMSILHLRRHPELRGVDAAVTAFWCGVAGIFSTAAAVLLMYRRYG
jgi:hypothetical protein